MFVGAALFTLAAAYAAGALLFPTTPVPRVIRLGAGAVLLSFTVFLLLLAGWAAAPVFSLIAATALALCAWRYRLVQIPAASRVTLWLWIPFGIYTAMYALQAMAPEIQPDAINYHLGLTAEYVRLHSFPNRIGFYEVIPQGLEMLFTMAYAWGGGSAAKLVHFCFLLATAPLMVAVGRQLDIAPSRSFAAALLYFAMPVAGIAGTSTYNDAALVFFTLATFYCLVAWHKERSTALLLLTGLFAGFCFAIKITGAPVTAGALIAVLVLARRPFPFLVVAASILVSVAPWVLRSALLTGNPLAPLFNAWFPNAYFNAEAERTLAANLRAYPGFTLLAAPVEYALRGRLQGIVGPLFFALPLALLALRKRVGRVLLLAALVSLLPWFANPGTRFLMPAVPFLALALSSLLYPALLAVTVAVQLVVSWPAVLQPFEAPFAWSFQEIPWRAAFRWEPEAAYLDRSIGEYAIARMIEERTGPKDNVFCLTGVAKAYTTRDVVGYWHSTPNEELAEALQTALLPPPMTLVESALPATPMTGIRVVAARASQEELRIFELRLHDERPGPAWQLEASPNRASAPLAIDGNGATSWRSRGATERGMFLTLTFDRPISAERIEIMMPKTNTISLLLETQTTAGGKWQTASDSPRTGNLPVPDLRRDATHALRRAGFRFILASAGKAGLDRVSDDMVKHTAEWGLRDRGEFTPVHLFEIE